MNMTAEIAINDHANKKGRAAGLEAAAALIREKADEFPENVRGGELRNLADEVIALGAGDADR